MPQVSAATHTSINKKIRLSFGRLASACADFEVVRLSLWTGMWLAVHTLVLTEWQSLFETVLDATNNDLVLGIAYCTAAGFALLQGTQWVHLVLVYATDVFLFIVPAIGSVCLAGLALSSQRIPLYGSFVVYHCCFEFMQPFVIVQVNLCMLLF